MGTAGEMMSELERVSKRMAVSLAHQLSEVTLFTALSQEVIQAGAAQEVQSLLEDDSYQRFRIQVIKEQLTNQDVVFELYRRILVRAFEDVRPFGVLH